jgi:aminomethyltransferase
LEEKADLLGKLEAADVPEADNEAAEAVRLENRRPRYGSDIDESLIPHETQQMHALHFSKGCYLGQEIVERVRSRGHLNKQLTALEIETAESVEPGTRVLQGEKDMGRITSAAFSPATQKTNAFAVLRVEASSGLAVNGAAATPTTLPRPA